MRDGACWGSMAWEQVVPAQPWGTRPWSRARAGQSHRATASLPVPEGEPHISLVLFQGRRPLGAQPLLVGALLLLVPTDDTSTTQGASVLCQEQLLPTSSAHHTRSSCTGSGRRVSGGLRRWSLGRGRSRAALRTKPGGSRLRAPTMSLSGVPPHPQSQLSRLRGACRSPGPRAGPGSCSTAAHKLLQPLRAAPAPAWLRNAGARRACGRGGSRQHRQGLQNSVPCPTELGGLIHRLLSRAWFGKGDAGISSNLHESGPVRSPLSLQHGGPFGTVLVRDVGIAGGREGRVGQGDAACPGRSMRIQLGAPAEPCAGQCKSNFVGSNGGKTSWKTRCPAQPCRVPRDWGVWEPWG